MMPSPIRSLVSSVSRLLSHLHSVPSRLPPTICRLVTSCGRAKRTDLMVKNKYLVFTRSVATLRHSSPFRPFTATMPCRLSPAPICGVWRIPTYFQLFCYHHGSHLPASWEREIVEAEHVQSLHFFPRQFQSWALRVRGSTGNIPAKQPPGARMSFRVRPFCCSLLGSDLQTHAHDGHYVVLYIFSHPINSSLSTLPLLWSLTLPKLESKKQDAYTDLEIEYCTFTATYLLKQHHVHIPSHQGSTTWDMLLSVAQLWLPAVTRYLSSIKKLASWPASREARSFSVHCYSLRHL